MTSFIDARSLPTAESWRRLSEIGFGRIFYHRHALPMVQPVDHVVDAGTILIHADPGALDLTAERQAVAYQADIIDVDSRAGWSVTVVGFAEDLTTADTRTLRQHELDSPHHHRVIRIRPDFITGTEYGARR